VALPVVERTIPLRCPACFQRCIHTLTAGAAPTVVCGGCGHETLEG